MRSEPRRTGRKALPDGRVPLELTRVYYWPKFTFGPRLLVAPQPTFFIINFEPNRPRLSFGYWFRSFRLSQAGNDESVCLSAFFAPFSVQKRFSISLVANPSRRLIPGSRNVLICKHYICIPCVLCKPTSVANLERGRRGKRK